MLQKDSEQREINQSLVLFEKYLSDFFAFMRYPCDLLEPSLVNFNVLDATHWVK